MIFIIMLLLSTIVNLFSLYTLIIRIQKIKNLSDDVLEAEEKAEYLGTLYNYLKVLIASSFISIISIILPIGSLRFVIPTISILVTSRILQTIFDEIESFEVDQKDIDVLKEFFAIIEKDVKEKDKIQKEKVKKEDAIRKYKDEDNFIDPV